MKSFSSFYKGVEGNEGEKCNYTIRLDSYGCGCQHDCNYCYAKSLLDFRGLWNPQKPVVASMKQVKSAIKDLIKNKTKIVRYGLLQKEFEKLKVENNGICSICNERKAEVIDHDHETGQVRGFICSKCNLGLYFIENIELKKKMEQYLKKKR